MLYELLNLESVLMKHARLIYILANGKEFTLCRYLLATGLRGLRLVSASPGCQQCQGVSGFNDTMPTWSGLQQAELDHCTPMMAGVFTAVYLCYIYIYIHIYIYNII